MGSYGLPALAVKPPEPGPSALDMYRTITAIKGAQQQQQLQQQEIQKNQLGLAQTQAINNAYHDALTTDAQGNPVLDKGKLTDALARNNHGSAIPGIIKSITEAEKASADVQETQGKNELAGRDSLGFLGSAIKKANYDPNLADLMIEQRLRVPGIPVQESQQLQQWRTQIQQNPEMLKTFADNAIAQSPKVREIEAQETTAAGRKAQGDAALQKTAPLPAPQISFLNKQLQNRYQVLNPGQPLPPEYTVPQGANRQTFEDISTSLEKLENAATARANRLQQQQIQGGARADARSEKSYQFNSSQLEKVAAPVDQAIARMGRLQDALAQGTPQADALIAPELLSVMAGGAGSGLRMNEAEIARIVGGRSKWESLQASINQWKTDPSKANSITPDQRQQIRALVTEVDNKLKAKQSALDEARQGLINSDDPAEHKRIVVNARNKMSAIDQGPQSQGGGMVTMQAPPGPNGEPGVKKQVPADQVEHYKSMGAKVVNQ